LHFTPTSSSWLNLVERWFAELTTKKLRRGAHRSVGQLNADIRAWIDTWNDNPKPFVWTKTTDQILDSIARYCQGRSKMHPLAPVENAPPVGASRKPVWVRGRRGGEPVGRAGAAIARAACGCGVTRSVCG
jgi:hypothetical protein